MYQNYNTSLIAKLANAQDQQTLINIENPDFEIKTLYNNIKIKRKKENYICEYMQTIIDDL